MNYNFMNSIQVYVAVKEPAGERSESVSLDSGSALKMHRVVLSAHSKCTHCPTTRGFWGGTCKQSESGVCPLCRVIFSVHKLFNCFCKITSLFCLSSLHIPHCSLFCMSMIYFPQSLHNPVGSRNTKKTCITGGFLKILLGSHSAFDDASRLLDGFL
jgi:hypothetical protein